MGNGYLWSRLVRCRSASREGGQGKTQAEALRLDDVVPANTKVRDSNADRSSSSKCVISGDVNESTVYDVRRLDAVKRFWRELESVYCKFSGCKRCWTWAGDTSWKIDRQSSMSCYLSPEVCLLKADCRGCETEAFHSGKQLLEAGAVKVRYRFLTVKQGGQYHKAPKTARSAVKKAFLCWLCVNLKKRRVWCTGNIWLYNLTGNFNCSHNSQTSWRCRWCSWNMTVRNLHLTVLWKLCKACRLALGSDSQQNTVSQKCLKVGPLVKNVDF